ncbi:MAG: nucleotide pyrophosphohydrolase [Agarilytica sp.]
MSQSIEELTQALLAFAEARDWKQFQSPKNLSMAIAVEAAELMEHFQWLSTEASTQLPTDKKQAASYELADVFMYTLLLAKRMNIDLMNATQEKMRINEEKYPADLVRGSAKKYDEY